MITPTQMKLVETNRAGKPVPKRREGYYVLDENRVYPSVTTILGVIAKPALIYWSAKVTAEALMEDPSLSIEDAIAEGRKRKEAAGAKGSTIHSWAEAWKQGSPLDAESLPESLRGYGKAFLTWADEVKPEILHSEFELFSDTHKIAGKTDMIATIRGNCALVDIKTGSGIYPEMGLQLSAYKECVNEMDLAFPKVLDTYILHLKADGNFDFRKMDESFEVFLAVRKLWSWQNKGA